MDWIRTVNNAIEYMEGHLTDEITLADIAKHVNLSAFHFQRAFSLLTEMSPAEYLRKRRLSQAGAELTGGDAKVIDVALKYCYDSPESFTKAFVRFHHASPRLVRKHPSLARVFLPIDIHIYILGGDRPSPDLSTSGACRVHIPHRDDPLPLFPVSVAGRAVHR